MGRENLPDPKIKSQRDRFIEKAREQGCDEDEDRFNETLKRLMESPAKKKPHGSDSSTK